MPTIKYHLKKKERKKSHDQIKGACHDKNKIPSKLHNGAYNKKTQAKNPGKKKQRNNSRKDKNFTK